MDLFDEVPIFDNIEDAVENIKTHDPTSYERAHDRTRPYHGQSWTDGGKRGMTMVEGLTMRDIRDCFIIGCYEASGLAKEDYPDSIYKLPWDEMDMIAVSQNMSCAIEKKMGIFPNTEGNRGERLS